MTEFRKWDPADYIDTPDDVVGYLQAAFAENDPKLLTQVLGDIARSNGVTEIARRAGVSREAIYKALTSKGDPRLSTFVGVLKALGVRLTVTPLKNHAA